MGTSLESGIMISNAMKRGQQTYSIYDGISRLVAFYEAPINAKHGSGCFLTEYKYEGATSVIIATKESVAVWDSALEFDALP